MLRCAFEEAWEAGKSSCRKPLSCQLYLVGLDRTPEGMEFLDYGQAPICSAACSKGEDLRIPVFRFVEEPLVQEFGDGFL